MIPWGGFFGLLIGRYTSKNNSGVAWALGFILAWIGYIVGILYAFEWRHLLSLVAAAVPFFLIGKGE